MIVVMNSSATEDNIQNVVTQLKSLGFGVHISQGVERTLIGAIGDKSVLEPGMIESMVGVANVMPIRKPYKLVSREIHQLDSKIQIKPGLFIGGDAEFVVMAGPCSVESEEQIFACAKAVAESGGTVLRGGAFKPRSSPYSFQGLGEAGLKMLRQAADGHGLAVVSEVMEIRQIELLGSYGDILQVGARNTQNFNLLKEVGRCKKPVLLKRGIAGTIEELLMSAEYIMSEGNKNVILCERGIRTFETMTRNTYDISAIPVMRKQSHLPVIGDPSHGIGKAEFVPDLALATLAAGAHGIMVEIHPDPAKALSDGPQSLTFAQYRVLMQRLKRMATLRMEFSKEPSLA